MYIQRLLQINVAALITLGALLLGMGQRRPLLPLGMLIAAILSVWLTDVTGRFRLNRGFTNVAAVAAFFIFLWQSTGLGGLARVLAIGNLLVYLQIILMFQEKESRTYWLLVLLSLLEVVVAAIFHQKMLFGFVLILYLFVALSALVLLLLHRERSRHRPTGGAPALPAAEGRRWPLAGQQPTFSDSTSGYAGQAGVARELRRRVAGIGLGTLVVTLVVFFTFPRWGHRPWRGAMAGTRRSVGFSDTIRLGELGKIIEDPSEVLRIEFFDYATQEPYAVSGEALYLRGTVLTHYERGQWSYPGPWSTDAIRLVGDTRPQSARGLVEQKITIEPMDGQELFCVWPFINTQKGQKLLLDTQRRVLLREYNQTTIRFAYTLATTAFHEGVQDPVTPVSGNRPVDTRRLLEPPPVTGEGAVPKLVELAEAWVSQSGLDPDDRHGCARWLEQRLRGSGRFEYSLQGQKRDPTVDPIEDFITNNPRGHCEYFATTLVLMLRSRGIPARMVVGYKTDEWNRLGGFFQVRQLHAHTWVEAYLEPRHVPSERDPGGRRVRRASGAWLRLEPTPAAAGKEVNAVVEAVGKAFGWLNFVWANYVIEMDQPRQHKAVYDPVGQSIVAIVRRLANPDWWRSTFRRLGAALGTGLRNLIIGLATAAALVLLAAALFGFRRLLRKWLRRFAARADLAKRSGRTRVEFYRRLEVVLTRFGLNRAPSQTQREFAREAGEEVAARTGQYQLADLPGQVVEAFYRVRFGAAALDTPQAEAVEHALARLKQAASRRQWAVGSG